MALLFHAATPDVSELDPAFAARLWVRLEEELRAMQQGQRPPLLRAERPWPEKQHISRRKLLTGGTVVAGSEWIIEQATSKSESPMTDAPTEWFFVTTVAELGNQAVQFASANLIGYVVQSSGTNGDPANRGQILALSAACTHKGCLVQWSGTDRTFRCPCHGGVFTEDGETDAKASTWLSLKPLPRLEVKVEEEGKIYVRVPA